MSGVNYELGPTLKMTTPKQWQEKPLHEWPTGETVFCSKILLFGFLPIDLHWIKFESVSGDGFRELSSSLINREWLHERKVSSLDSCTVVRDEVGYECKLKVLGNLLLPIYKRVFTHRHQRLVKKYRVNS